MFYRFLISTTAGLRSFHFDTAGAALDGALECVKHGLDLQAIVDGQNNPVSIVELRQSARVERMGPAAAPTPRSGPTRGDRSSTASSQPSGPSGSRTSHER